MQKLEFLIIDPQNDFCSKIGSLFVPGADDDSERLANLIKRMKNQIDDIHVTLDTHHFIDIAHPIFWIDKNGNHPGNYDFVIISEDDILNGKWRTTNPAHMNRSLEYVRELKKNNRYMLCVWPPHCLIGTWGHNVIDSVGESLREWENDFAMVDYVTKGSNFWTEHYSAICADVPDPKDPSTMLNVGLIKTLQNADIIAFSGQALSHCVANTLRDIANNFGEENIKKMVLLEDTTSSVQGFEYMGDDFIKEMKLRGMKTCRAKDFNI